MVKSKAYTSDFNYFDNKIKKNLLESINTEVIGLQYKTG
ncbi:hypothetical protein ES705_41315 [subsurface metagenome]